MSDNEHYDDDRPRARPHNGRSGGYAGGGGYSSYNSGMGGYGGGLAGYGGAAAGGAQPAELPLRMLVNSELVGAIIGRQGNTIRQITQKTRARVDVHRKDSSGATEKAITIYGNPENCDNACREILEVIAKEVDPAERDEVQLKILAHNNLIGRIIGKGGNVIKGIMEETDTKITVSRATDVNSFNMDRTISIRGSLDGMAEAEKLVMARLRQSYENDMQSPLLHGLYMNRAGLSGGGGGPGLAQSRESGPGLYGASPAGYGLYGGGMPATGGMGLAGPNETAYMYVPSAAVGALIGRKGGHIRNIIRFSGASVKIGQEEEAPLGAGPRRRRSGDENGDDDDEEDDEEEARDVARAEMDRADRPSERKVTIFGTPDAQWKAQYMIFEKLREEGYGAGLEDVRLSVEIMVPSSQVGRIIGKKGQNVRELQRSTGTVIRLPQPPAEGDTAPETIVHMAGPFCSLQSAQRRIRALVAQGVPPPGQLGKLGRDGASPGLM